jgi:hypothetical protein
MCSHARDFSRSSCTVLLHLPLFPGPSSSFIEDVPSFPVEPSSLTDSSSEKLVRRSHRLHRPPDCYSPLAFIATALFEPASSHDDILHLKWQHVMAEEIAAVE